MTVSTNIYGDRGGRLPPDRAPAGVLVVEDRAADRRDLTALLEKEGYEVLAAPSAREALDWLRDRPFELAITHLEMPGMDGIETLKALREADPSMQVIVVSDYPARKSASRALKEGACDLLEKPIHPPTLRLALARARALYWLSKSPSLLWASRALLETSRPQQIVPAILALARRAMGSTEAALALVSCEAKGLKVNPAPGNGRLTEPVLRAWAERAIEARQGLHADASSSGSSEPDEAKTPAGSLLAYPLETGTSRLGALVLWRDQSKPAFETTERRFGEILAGQIALTLENARLSSELSKKKEELETARNRSAGSEARARRIIETAQEAIILFERNGAIREVNPKALEIFGGAREQIVGRNLAEFAVPPRLSEVFQNHVEAAYERGRDPACGCVEVVASRLNGEEFPFEISTVVIDLPQGRLLSTFGRDISERKRRQQSIRESESKLQAIFEGIETGILVIDPATHQIVDANSPALTLIGTDRAHVVGSVCHKFVCPAEKGRCPVTDLGQVIDRSERKLLTTDSESRDIIKTVRPIVIAGRSLLLESFVDITARKQAERALAGAEAQFHSLFACNPLPIYFFDAETLQYLDVNEAAVSMTGYSHEEFRNLRVTDLVPPEFIPPLVSSIRALHPHSVERTGGVCRPKDGRLIDVETDFLALDFRGRRAVLAVAQDVTKRKQTEAEMVERHRMATLVAEIGVVLTRTDGLREGLQQCAEILGRNIDAAFTRIWTLNESENILELQASAGMYTHLDGEHARIPMGRFKIGRIAESGEPHLTNAVLEDPWVGDPEWARREGMVAFAGCPLKVGPRVLGVVAAFARHALTENILQAFSSVAGSLAQFIDRQRAEESLRDSEGRFRTVFEEAPYGMCMTALDGRFLQANAALCRMLGYSPQELLAGAWQTITHPDDLERSRKAAAHFAGGAVTPIELEKRYIHKQGRVVWARLKISAVKDGRSKSSYCFAQIEDITLRKQAEDARKEAELALKKSENRYRLLFERNLAGVLRTTAEGQIQECNDSMARMLGYNSARDLIEIDIRRVWNDVSDRERMLAKLAEQKRLINYEVRLRRRDGQPIWTLLNIHQSESKAGAPRTLEATVIDITTRKQAEGKLLVAQFAIEHASDAITWLDAEGRIVYVNKATCDFLGRSREELLSLTVNDIYPDFGKGAWEEWKRSRAATLPVFETRGVTRQGRVFPVEVTASRLEFGGREYVFCFARDITRKKEAERQVNLQAAALKAAGNAIVITDRRGRVEWSNPAFTFLTGHEDSQVLGQNPRLWKSGVQDGEFYQRLWNTILSGEVWRGELVNRRKDGTLYTEQMTVTPVRDVGGNLTHFVAIKQDVTERKRAERALEERTVYLNTLFEISPLGIVVLDTAGRIQMSNSAFERLFLFPRAEISGRKLDDFIVPPECASEAAALTSRSLQGTSGAVSSRRRRKDGTCLDVDIYGVPVVIEGKPLGILALYQDITERKRAEERLRASEERYRDLFENASDIVYTTGLDLQVTSLNRVGQQLLGYTGNESSQLNLLEIAALQHREMAKRAHERLLAGETDITIEMEVCAKDGRRVTLEVKPRVIYKGQVPVGVQGIARDITGRDAAELELRHVQKLESVGRLASGIAHEINTPIQFVGDNARFLQDSFAGLRSLIGVYHELRQAAESGAVSSELLARVRHMEEESDCDYLVEEIPRALSQSLDGVTRVATIVRAMKEFAHPECKEMAAADINRALQSTMTVARNELKYVADVETDLGDLPLVVCNISDLNQVFLNLLVNAAHAIAEIVQGSGEKGKIRVCTRREEETVLIAISDTGGGIPEAIRGRIFDPFFTTKEVGRGTGQGLAIARSVVVDRHNGSLTFESELGKGTTFYVRLPLNPPEPSKEAGKP